MPIIAPGASSRQLPPASRTRASFAAFHSGSESTRTPSRSKMTAAAMLRRRRLLQQARAGPRGAHGGVEGDDVVRPAVPPAVDEEGRRAGHPARVGARHVRGHALGVLMATQLVPEAVHVKAELLG